MIWLKQIVIFIICVIAAFVRQWLITDPPNGDILFYSLLKDMSMGSGSVPLPIGVTAAIIGCYLISGIVTSFIEKGAKSLAAHTVIISIIFGSGLIVDRHFAGKRWGTEGAQVLAIMYQEGFDYARKMNVEVGTDRYIKLKKAGINTLFAVDNCSQLDNGEACKAWEVGLYTGSGKKTMINIIME